MLQMVNDDRFNHSPIDSGKRHFVTIDAVSILENDATTTFEEKSYEHVDFSITVKKIKSSVGKFIFMGIYFGYSKYEIADMLGVHPSTVTRIHQRISQMLKIYLSQQNRAIIKGK